MLGRSETGSRPIRLLMICFHGNESNLRCVKQVKKAALTDLRLHQIRHILPSCRIVLLATNRFYAFNVTNTHSDFMKRMTRSQIFDKKQDDGDRETNKNQ
jgi:hypothetical protein